MACAGERALVRLLDGSAVPAARDRRECERGRWPLSPRPPRAAPLPARRPSRRARAGSAPPRRARRRSASERRFVSSTTSNGSTKSVRQVGGVVDDPRHALPRARPDGEHRPAPRCVEVLLQMLAPAAFERTSCSSLSVTRWRPLRSSARSLRSRGDALSRTSEPSSSTARPIASPTGFNPGSIAAASSDRSGVSTEPRTQRQPSTVSATCRSAPVVRTPPRAARLRASRTSRIPRSSGAERLVEERDRLGGQRLPVRHLGRIGRRRERPGELGARSIVAAAATRSRIGGGSSSSSAKASITTSVGPSRRSVRLGRT